MVPFELEHSTTSKLYIYIYAVNRLYSHPRDNPAKEMILAFFFVFNRCIHEGLSPNCGPQFEAGARFKNHPQDQIDDIGSYLIRQLQVAQMVGTNRLKR